MLNYIKNIYRDNTFLIAGILVCILIGLNTLHSANLTMVDGDTASHVLMAVAPFKGLGSPYKNIWDIDPPGLYIFLGIWTEIFGLSILGFKVLQILLLLAIGLSTVLIYRRVLFHNYVLLITFLSLAVLFSPYLFTIFLPSELIGLMFSVLGLMVLFYVSSIQYKLFFSVFLFFMSGQMKDPFSFTIFSIIPFFIYYSFFKKKAIISIISTIVGFISGFALIYIYLILLHASNAYWQVLEYKANAFGVFDIERLVNNYLATIQTAQDIIIYFQFVNLFLIFILIAIFFSVLSKTRNLKISSKKNIYNLNININFTERSLYRLTIICYVIGSFIGFTEADNFGSHYLIQVVLPLYFLFGIIISLIIENLRYGFPIFRTNLFFLLIFIPSLIVVLPKSAYIKSYKLDTLSPSYFLSQFFTAERYHNLSLEEYLDNKTGINSCILNVYGWGSGDIYLYADRKPCTRFFLPNIVSQDWQMKEYRISLINHPPRAIIYNTAASDMNVDRFEKNVINISKIIKGCYLEDKTFNNLFLPNRQINLRRCINKYEN